jgi:hypothetical protein
VGTIWIWSQKRNKEDRTIFYLLYCFPESVLSISGMHWQPSKSQGKSTKDESKFEFENWCTSYGGATVL